MFKNYFQSLSSVQKLEVYSLVVIIYMTILYFSDDIFSILKFDGNEKDPKVIEYYSKINSLRSNISTNSKQDVIKFIERSTSSHKVFLEYVTIQGNSIDLGLNGNLLDVMNLLKSYQQNLFVLGFSLEKVKDSINCKIKLNGKYFYNKDKTISKITKIYNPFVINKEKQITRRLTNSSIVIKAIISDEVLIGESWYRVGDIINNKRIAKITSTNIELIDIKTDARMILGIRND